MKLKVKDISGQETGEYEVRFEAPEGDKGTQAIHDVVVAYMAAQRSGSANTKTKGEVAGSGKKPWRQKGTGRARVGSVRSPLWEGGGVVFGPKPRDYRKKVTPATKRLALRKAVAERIEDGAVTIVDDLKLQDSKTKAFIKILKSLSLEGSTLVVCGEVDKNLVLASRNVPDVVSTVGDLVNTYEVLKYKNIVFTKGAFEKLENRLNSSK